jgi:hypothetical protein
MVRFAWARSLAWRRTFDEYRSSQEPGGGIVRDRTIRLDRVATFDGGDRSDRSTGSGS